MHVDEPLNDPQSGRKFGYLAIYTGTAQLTRPGQVAKATLTDSARETLQGDVLVAEDTSPTGGFRAACAGPAGRRAHHRRGKTTCCSPASTTWSRSIAARRTAWSAARCSRSTWPGSRSTITARKIEGQSTCWAQHMVQLPDESSGTLLVFKTYERMSYALILSDTVPINVGDRVRNP